MPLLSAGPAVTPVAFTSNFLYSQLRQLQSCIDSRVRVTRNALKLRGTTIFGKNLRCIYRHERVKPLQHYCPCLPASILLLTKKLLFWKKMLCSGNLILCRLAKCCVASIFVLDANSTSNFMTLFVLVLHVLTAVLGFILLNQFSLHYTSFCVMCALYHVLYISCCIRAY